jgi:hypothetical protein
MTSLEKKQKTAKQYTRLYDAIMYSPTLSSNEKLVYYSIKSHLWNDTKKGTERKQFWASKETLGKIVGISDKTVQRILKNWRMSGYLTVIQANRFKPVKYQFNEDILLADCFERGRSVR